MTLINSYRQAMAVPSLSFEEEADLIARWKKDKDQKAIDKLIRANLKVCYWVAMQYSHNEEHVKDLVQESIEGLLKAAEKYDPEMGNKFATYATWWVKTCVSKHISKVAVVVKIPSRLYLKARQANDDEEVGWEAKMVSGGEVSLDSPYGGEDSDTLWSDVIASNTPTPETMVINDKVTKLCETLIQDGLNDCMSVREREIVRLRRLGDPPKTLEEIAEIWGVSRERVRQIEITAMEKLKQYIISKGFHISQLS